jgi:hypothetical protein
MGFGDGLAPLAGEQAILIVQRSFSMTWAKFSIIGSSTVK